MNIQHRVNQTQASDINLRETLAIISAGGGHSSLKKFCGTMDLAALVTSHLCSLQKTVPENS